MTVAISPGDWLRIASGALYLAFGGAIALSRWRMPAVRWLGFTLVGVGLMAVGTNFATDERALLLAYDAVGGTGITIASVSSVLLLRATHGARAVALAIVGAAAYAAVVLAASAPGPETLISQSASGTAFGALYVASFIVFTPLGLAVPIALALRPVSDDAPRARALATLALGLGLFPFVFATHMVTRIGPVDAPLGWAAAAGACAAALTSTCVLAWAGAAHGPAGARARHVALAFVALPVVLLLAGVAGARFGLDLGTMGLARIVAIAVVAHAVLRLDALGAGFGRKTASRGSLAAAGVAALLIVAQVAQNFLSAQYSLLMGGVLSGALIFAARPIERALERGRPEPPSAFGNAAARERSFLSAARRFQRDGTVTPAEERELMILAEHLGISASRAYELRDQVERERT